MLTVYWILCNATMHRVLCTASGWKRVLLPIMNDAFGELMYKSVRQKLNYRKNLCRLKYCNLRSPQPVSPKERHRSTSVPISRCRLTRECQPAALRKPSGVLF